jgi:hypothetical protein
LPNDGGVKDKPVKRKNKSARSKKSGIKRLTTYVTENVFFWLPCVFLQHVYQLDGMMHFENEHRNLGPESLPSKPVLNAGRTPDLIDNAVIGRPACFALLVFPFLQNLKKRSRKIEIFS